MSKPMSLLQTLPEDVVLVDGAIVPRVASDSDLELMKQAAKDGKLDAFEDMFKFFKPTAKMWEMRMLANAYAFRDDERSSRQFQICLQVANDMRTSGYEPTAAMKSNLTKIAKSDQQLQKLQTMPWYTYTTTPKGGRRSKIRRQIRTRALARFNKSKKCRGRRVRRTRNRNHS